MSDTKICWSCDGTGERHEGVRCRVCEGSGETHGDDYEPDWDEPTDWPDLVPDGFDGTGRW